MILCMRMHGNFQGCSLGLDVSVSRRSRDVVSKRLGLVSVSCHRVSFTSQYAQLFASLQNYTYIVLNARRLCCLLIHKSKRLTVCTTQNYVGRQQSTLQHVTLMPFVYQVCHSIGSVPVSTSSSAATERPCEPFKVS